MTDVGRMRWASWSARCWPRGTPICLARPDVAGPAADAGGRSPSEPTLAMASATRIGLRDATATGSEAGTPGLGRSSWPSQGCGPDRGSAMGCTSKSPRSGSDRWTAPIRTCGWTPSERVRADGRVEHQPGSSWPCHATPPAPRWTACRRLEARPTLGRQRFPRERANSGLASHSWCRSSRGAPPTGTPPATKLVVGSSLALKDHGTRPLKGLRG
jgi:hypothetical protein